MMKDSDNILAIDPNARVVHCKKGQILQHAGALNADTFYVKKGLLRSYIIDSKGKEHIFTFATEGWVIADVESLEYNKPVELFIDCLEDSEVVSFQKRLLLEGEVSSAVMASSLRLLYRRLGRLQRRVLMLMSAPAIDRYEHFLATYPDLPNRVPQHMIATYLGITPQALSSIRSKIAHSK